jgi:hypothetical protein
VPYRRCPRCGLSSYLAVPHNHPALCPHCERPLPPPADDDGADLDGGAPSD